MIRADRTGPEVLPAAVADASDRARAIVQRAQARVETFEAEALERARVQARAEVAAQLLALAEQRERALAGLESQAIELALLAAKRIVGEELALRPERVAEMVAPLLARVRRARQVTLRVHPDDRGQLLSMLPALCERADLQGSLGVMTDPALGRGDCVVISDAGVLDARIDTQLHALARALGVK